MKRFKDMKPIERRFWIRFLIIKGIMFLMVLALFIYFAIRFKHVFWE